MKSRGMTINVVGHWEELVTDLRMRIQNGDESCRTLLIKTEAELYAAREKNMLSTRDRHER